MAAPPADPPFLGHGSIRTTTGTIEPAPEILLTRGYNKRSLAAIETEFVDNNDINGMAPSSAVLQSDFLIMDDANNLEEKLDMSDHVILTHPPLSPVPPAHKRVRYAPSETEPTASDYAQLEPIIQPDGHRDTTQRPRQQSSSRSHSMSRRRSIADLVPPSSQRAPVFMDELEATVEYGEPVDSSSATLAIDISERERPSTPLSSKYPGSSKVTSGVISLELEPIQGTENSPMVIDSDSGSITSSSNHNMNSSNSNIHNKDNSHETQHSPPAKTSSLFMPPSHASAGHQRRNSVTLAAKKGIQRPVRIQLLDKAESEMMREQVRRASTSDDQEIQDQDDDNDNDNDVAKGLSDPSLRNNSADEDGDDSDVALPKEDPIVHDWDKEDLEDEESSRGTPSSTGGSPLPLEVEAASKRRQSIADDIRRASEASGTDPRFKQAHTQSRTVTRNQASTGKGQDDDDEDDDTWDPLVDPEREVAVMTEDQEADLHNMHIRLENQRDFQDAAGLDLGEDEAQAVNEDGRYGGAIEDDDEGEDYWENR